MFFLFILWYSHTDVKLLITFIYLVCVHVEEVRSQLLRQFSPPTMWVLGIRLRPIIRLIGKCLFPLTHLATPISKI